MPANTSPIFGLTPVLSWGEIATANTAKDGTGTVVTIFTAGANGARVDKIRYKAKGTNVATVLRVFTNNGSTNATAANNSLYHEETVAATTLSEVAALTNGEVAIPDGLLLPAGYKLNITIGTTIAAGLHVSAQGADF
ncbi:MAG: hypothetical protein ACREXW_00970 [Gammaproteobacteria bacterium]